MWGYSDPYALLVCMDACKHSYGAALYPRKRVTNKISFLSAKNRLIPQSNTRTMPVVELFALTFGVEVGQQVGKDLGDAFSPINTANSLVLTDSTIALN